MQQITVKHIIIMKHETKGDKRLNYSCPALSVDQVTPEMMFQSDGASTIDYLTEEEGNFEWN